MGGRALLLPLELICDLPGSRHELALARLRKGEAGAAPGYARALVQVARPGDLDRVEKAIREMGFGTHTLLGQIKEWRASFLLMDVVLTAVGTVALVVAGLGIINTLLMSVLERYREIGIYKAIGASDGDVRVLFLVEAALVGVLGGLGGIVLGCTVSFILNSF